MTDRISAAATLIVFSVLVLTGPARAEGPIVLRVATVAPDGTAWAREMKAFDREVESATGGAVRIKLYLGGIAGDELTTLERLRRGQLDGMLSGGLVCEHLAPSLRALRVFGLVQSREEAQKVVARLRPTLEEEFEKAGFVDIGEAILGALTNFSSRPVRSMEDLRRARFWVWDIDEMLKMQVSALALPSVQLPLEQAGRGYDDGRLDSFLTVPAAALAFQWSAKTHYISSLPLGYLVGCLTFSRAAFDKVPHDARQIITTAAAKLRVRLEDVGRAQDARLLDGLFARQGLTVLPTPDGFRREFDEAARQMRARLGEKLLPAALLSKVSAWFAAP
jgi:TRAP-type C4-dicarboxylate transport system substrate-binding protein